MPDVEMLERSFGRSVDNRGTVTDDDTDGDASDTCSDDDECMDGSMILAIRGHLEHRRDNLSEIRDELEGIEKLFNSHGYSDVQTIDILRSLAAKANEVSEQSSRMSGVKNPQHRGHPDPNTTCAKMDPKSLLVNEAKPRSGEQAGYSSHRDFMLKQIPDMHDAGNAPLDDFDFDDDSADGSDAPGICADLEESLKVLLETQDDLKGIERRPRYQGPSEMQISLSLRRIGSAAFELNECAHDLAARRFFDSHNPKYCHEDPKIAYAMINLHDLYTNEAVTRANEHLNYCKQAGLSQTEIIHGWGKHGKGGGNIKAALIKMFQSKAVKHNIDPRNPGRLIVSLNNSGY